MDADSWTARLSSPSKRYQSALLSRSGLGMFTGFEEFEGDDDIREEFPCPFCAEYFDIVGLCCHIDEEHPIEAKNGTACLSANVQDPHKKIEELYELLSKVIDGKMENYLRRTKVCPVCEMRVGVNMVPHISLQHGNIFKMQRKRKSRKGGSHSTLSLLRKELQEGHFQSLFGGSSGLMTSSNAAPDPLLSSFILPLADDYSNVQPHLLAESSSVKSNSQDKLSERSNLASPLSVQDKEEKAKRSAFVQGLVMSTIFDDHL